MFHRILLAADGSAASEAAVRQAFALAQTSSEPLHVVTVVDVFGAYYATPESIVFLQNEGHKLLQSLQHRAQSEGISVVTRLLETDTGGKHISDLILAEAERMHAQLIILGSHGWRGMRKLLIGSVAQTVCQAAHCSVLIARQ